MKIPELRPTDKELAEIEEIFAEYEAQLESGTDTANSSKEQEGGGTSKEKEPEPATCEAGDMLGAGD